MNMKFQKISRTPAITGNAWGCALTVLKYAIS